MAYLLVYLAAGLMQNMATHTCSKNTKGIHIYGWFDYYVIQTFKEQYHLLLP
jgi:hypothetical protein